MFSFGLTAASIVASSRSAVIDRNHALNLTMFHINPISAGVVPRDEDTGDLDGILRFFLDTLTLPLECASNVSSFAFDCTNPERTSQDMVHTFMDIEVDDRLTGYSLCNLCTDGTDKVSNKPCTIGEYQCNCGWGGKGDDCDLNRVGVEDVNATQGPSTKPECKAALADLCQSTKVDGDRCHSCLTDNADILALNNCSYFDTFNYCPLTSSCQAALDGFCGDVKTDKDACSSCAQTFAANLTVAGCGDYAAFSYCPGSGYGAQCEGTGTIEDKTTCWKSNIAKKTGGKWFSTVKEAHCETYSGNGTCGWQINSMFTVNDTCVRDSIYSSVEDAGPECFAPCGDRNVSSACWIACFFDTWLGPDAHKSSSADLSKGLPMVEVEQGYLNAFKSESEGGCPRIPTDHAGKALIV